MNTHEKIQRVGERGQITLPSEWRKQYATSAVRIQINGDKLEIMPLVEDEWESVIDFSKINTKGIPVKEILSAIKKLK